MSRCGSPAQEFLPPVTSRRRPSCKILVFAFEAVVVAAAVDDESGPRPRTNLRWPCRKTAGDACEAFSRKPRDRVSR